MLLIQIFLTIGVLFIGLYVFQKFRPALVFRLVICLFVGGAVFIIYDPDSTNVLAHFLGVQRGVDMLFYFGFLILTFIVIKLYAKTRKLQADITELVRHNAVKDIEK